MDLSVGDVIEPINREAPLPCGLYQILDLTEEEVRLSRLHSNEDGKLATTNRTATLPRSALSQFRRLRLLSEERP